MGERLVSFSPLFYHPRMSTLENVREHCEYLDELAGDDVRHAVEVMMTSLALAKQVGPCAHAEMLGVLGAARRKLGKYTAATADFKKALNACTCDECLPRIRRRQSILLACTGEHELAKEYIAEAIYGFALIPDFRWVARSLAARSVIQRFAGEIPEAIKSARRARNSIPSTDAHHHLAALQNLAYLLTVSGRPEDWNEISECLTKSQGTLRRLTGFRDLKRMLRYTGALADAQMGHKRTACKRLSKVLDEMLGKSLSVPRDLAKAEAERVRRKARAAPLDIAAVLSDYALLGGDPARIADAAVEVLALKPEGEHIRACLIELRDAAERRLDVRLPAFGVRAECPGSPALPPCLQKVA